MPRNSDRWVTPAVVVWGMVLGTIVVLATVAAVTWLTYLGRDPGPMLDLVAKVVTAIGTLGTLGLQLANRATVTKVERNTGALATDRLDRLDATDRLGRHGALPPVPGRGTAPAAGRGS